MKKTKLFETVVELVREIEVVELTAGIPLLESHHALGEVVENAKKVMTKYSAEDIKPRLITQQDREAKETYNVARVCPPQKDLSNECRIDMVAMDANTANPYWDIRLYHVSEFKDRVYTHGKDIDSEEALGLLQQRCDAVGFPVKTKDIHYSIDPAKIEIKWPEIGSSVRVASDITEKDLQDLCYHNAIAEVDVKYINSNFKEVVVLKVDK